MTDATGIACTACSAQVRLLLQLRALGSGVAVLAGDQSLLSHTLQPYLRAMNARALLDSMMEAVSIGDASPVDAAGLDWGRNGTARAAADEKEEADDEDAAAAEEGAGEGEAPAAVAANIGLAAAMLAFFAWRAARLLLVA